jgi:hypothetical protein
VPLAPCPQSLLYGDVQQNSVAGLPAASVPGVPAALHVRSEKSASGRSDPVHEKPNELSSQPVTLSSCAQVAPVAAVAVKQQKRSSLPDALGMLQTSDGSESSGAEPAGQLKPAPWEQATLESKLHVVGAQQKSPAPSVLQAKSPFVSSGRSEPEHDQPLKLPGHPTAESRPHELPETVVFTEHPVDATRPATIQGM